MVIQNVSESVTMQIPRRWRVNWGGIFAGFMVFVAVTMVLVSLGTAMALTFGDGVPGALTTIWIALSTLVGIWLGGVISGQWIEREQNLEAATNGILLWGLAFIAFIALAINGIEMGLGALFGIANVVPTHLSPTDIAQIQAQLNLSDAEFSSIREMLTRGSDIFTPETARQAAWWSLVGIVLSMGSAVCGALVGGKSNLITRELEVLNRNSKYKAA